MSQFPRKPHGKRRPRRLIYRNLTVCLALIALGAAALIPSVLTRTRGGGGEQSNVTSEVSKEQRAKPAARATQEGAYRLSLEAKLSPPALRFPNAHAPMLRTARAEASPAAPGARPEDEDGDARADAAQDGQLQSSGVLPAPDRAERFGDRRPREEHLKKARTFDGDLRALPSRRPSKLERPEREGPRPNPGIRPATSISADLPERVEPGVQPAPSAPAPSPTKSFDGLDFNNWGSGHPPDTVGDVGPTYYVQAVNASVGIFRKSDGVRVAAFTLNTLMSQGAFGNLCDTDNFGDPVVLYDTFEDRWIITDFAFKLSGGAVVNPPGTFQCIAVSKSGDPVSGGWNFYSINTANGLGDYPKFGIWPDGLYMTTSMFAYMNSGAFQSPRFYAFNKAQMYAGESAVQVVSFDGPAEDFTVLPSNARLQTGTPPAGTPNYFVSTWNFTNALTVYKFHVDWDRPALSTLTGPDTPVSATGWPNQAVANAPSQGGSTLDVLQIRAMMQNQYTNLGGVESLWDTHTVRRAVGGFAAPRWYQLDVTGGVVNEDIAQAATFDPDGADVLHRFIPSLAVDRAGDMALGYSTSSSTTKPAIKYAGRLATDPANTFSQGEQLLIQGAGTQVGLSRWGDYAAMSLDPDGCTFWFTSEYYAVDGSNDLTRIGAFAFPQCTPVGAGGTLSGTVTDNATHGPVSGATVKLGSRTTTTNASGVYTFAGLPAGTYPNVNVAAAGYGSSSASGVNVADAATTTKDFALASSQANACPTDTSLADFQTAASSNVDVATSAGNAVLAKPSLDQFNVNVSNNGINFDATTWVGQTFTPSVTGKLKSADLQLFCSGCTGTTPNLTVSVRATSGGLPTGADLAAATINGFNSDSAIFYTATFVTPATLTAGTQYALLVRPAANPSAGTFAAIVSVSNGGQGFDTYSGGAYVAGSGGGTSWSVASFGGSSADCAFHTYMDSGFAASGELTSALKDANPAANSVTHWTTLSWNATTPANTSVKFQAAASNSALGPFNFVGPDGTPATYFTTSGASLSQFNGKRYLKYKAYLGTSYGTATPTLGAVSACFADAAPSIAAGAAISRQRGSASVNSQIATAGDTFFAAGTLSVTATPSTGSGVGVNNIAVDAAGNVTADVTADCSATNSTFTLKVTNGDGTTATTPLTVNVSANTAPTLAYNSDSVNVNASKTVNPSAAPSDNGSVSSIIVQSLGTYTGGVSVNATTGAVTLTNAAPAGTHTILIRATDNCGTATDASLTLTVNKLDQTISFGALSDKTYGDADIPLSAGATSGLTVTFAASGNCTLTNGGAVHITGAGSCTVKASQVGDSIYNAASDVSQTFQIAKAATATALSSSAAAPTPGQSVTFTATITSAAGTPTGSVQFKVDGSNLGSPATLNASGQATFTTNTLAPGAHSVTADYGGDSNFLTSSGALAGGQSVGSVFEFSQASYSVAERGGFATITVNRTGVTTQAASVNYVTDDNSLPTVFTPCSATTGQASERCDYERAAGTLRFAAGETQKTFDVLINDDSYTEGTETLALRFNSPSDGAGFGPKAVAVLQITDDATESAGNPSDDSAAFVRQHYRDFLNREADAPGLAFWTNEIEQCGTDLQCREVKRINVSAAFFLSIEFQETGYLVYRMDKAAFGDINPPTVPVPLRIDEFLSDAQEIQRGIVVGRGNWQPQLEANKNAFALAFVQRLAFTSRYPATMSAADFVGQLDFFAGGVLSPEEKAALVAELAPSPADANLRAAVLRKVAEDADLVQREKNRAFVLMQYFGYLRRNPNDAPEAGLDFAGFNFWSGKLNQFNGDYIAAEMVKAFISSDEYRKRFGQ
ncbi:MAG TPA: Ig-like domain repeat protein [Pyrinomonadaceae bacterium]|nr:Ig-like domain repeat protein [Pyrinomonadaceae bacterium]